MSLIKTHLHKIENAYPIELTLTLNDVEYLIGLLEETDDQRENMLADEIRTQTYAQIQSLSLVALSDERTSDQLILM